MLIGRPTRRVVFWGGVGAVALVALLHTLSLTWIFGFGGQDRGLVVCDGEVLYTRKWHSGVTSGAFAVAPADPLYWGFTPVEFSLPIWVLAVPAGLASYSARWAGRKPTPGRCATCGYDRSGLAPNGFCPECGSADGESGEIPRDSAGPVRRLAGNQWLSLAVTALIVVPCAIGIGWSRNNEIAYARDGSVVVELIDGEARLGYGARTHRYPFNDGLWIGPSGSRSLGSSYHPSVRIPLWIPMVVTIGVYGAGWYRSRRGPSTARLTP